MLVSYKMLSSKHDCIYNEYKIMMEKYVQLKIRNKQLQKEINKLRKSNRLLQSTSSCNDKYIECIQCIESNESNKHDEIDVDVDTYDEIDVVLV